jgi:phage I-like protein
MKTKSYFLESIDLADVASGGKAIQLLKVGEFKHPTSGTIEITKSDLQRFKSNFDAKVMRTDPAINYEHLMSSAHGTKAAGWIKELTLKNDDTELWATPEWTPEGLRQIKDKEFRYLSSEILWSYTDNETGKKYERVLKGAALTNYPVIKGMEPIMASLPGADKSPKGVKKMDLREAKLALSEAGIDFVEYEKTFKAAPALAAELSEVKASLVTVTKERDTLKTEVVKLSDEAEKATKAAEQVKFSSLVERGMKEGKLTKVMAEGTFKTMFDKMGIEFCEAHLKEMPKAFEVKPEGHGNDNPNLSDAKDPYAKVQAMAEEIVKKSEGKVSFSEACKQVLVGNKKLSLAYTENVAQLAGNPSDGDAGVVTDGAE